MLRCFTDQNFDWWGLRVHGFSLLDNSLYRIAQKLADNVFEMTQDVREGGLQVAVDLDLWNLDMVAVSTLDQLLGGLSARFNNLFRITSEKDLSYRFLILRRLCVREMPG